MATRGRPMITTNGASAAHLPSISAPFNRRVSPTVPFPDDVTANVAGDQVTLSWVASFRASDYNVYRSESIGGPYTLL